MNRRDAAEHLIPHQLYPKTDVAPSLCFANCLHTLPHDILAAVDGKQQPQS
jgi:hypothetical protein